MKLVNMLESAEDSAKECAPCYPSGAKPMYPYELRITLNDDSLKKLGIDKLPDINSVIDLTAKVSVIRIVDESGFYGRERCLGLQITDLALGTPSDPDAAEDAAGGEKEGGGEY